MALAAHQSAISTGGSPGATLTSDSLISLRAHVRNTAKSQGPATGLPGSFILKRRGTGQDIADIRTYIPGDDIRHLDRGATARTGSLHIRTFQEERDCITLLVADFRPSMLWGTRRAFLSVAAAEALSILGWKAVDDGGRVSLLALTAAGPVIVPARGRTRGMVAAIGGLVEAHDQALATGVAVDEPPLDAALAAAERLTTTGTQIVLATGFERPSAGLHDLMAHLSMRRAVRAILIEDRGVAALPGGTYPIELRDGRAAMAHVSETSTGGHHRPDVTVHCPDAVAIDRIDSCEGLAPMLQLLEG